MKLQIALYQSDEGFAVCAPSLPGCWSQGKTREEAVENIRVAIGEYLEAEDELPGSPSTAERLQPDDSPALSEAVEIRDVEVAD